MRAILFDIDGTLVDSVDLHARAWQESLARFEVEVPFERVRGQIGKGGDNLMRALVPAARLAEIEDALDRHRAELFRSRYLERVVAFPGVRPLFERLRADGLAIALASSAKRQELDHYLKVADVADLIDSATTGDDAERTKPCPDIFEAALRTVGDPPAAECAVVGDSPYDAEAAGRAGLVTIGVLCGGFSAGELTAAGCARLFRDPADLLATYEREGAAVFAGG